MKRIGLHPCTEDCAVANGCNMSRVVCDVCGKLCLECEISGDFPGCSVCVECSEDTVVCDICGRPVLKDNAVKMEGGGSYYLCMECNC